MQDILAQLTPFFALIALGWGAAWSGLFGPDGARFLTRFVFYFPLSALLFRFASDLQLGAVFDPRFIAAYVLGTALVYGVAAGASALRGQRLGEIAVEAQCATVGNIAFLGVPVVSGLFGEGAIGAILQILVVDAVLLSGLIVILFSIDRTGRFGVAAFRPALKALSENPMMLSIAAGLIWAAFGLPIPGPAARTLDILSAAATPGALFAIGLSLAGKSAERVQVAAWLAAAKLGLHPLAVAATAFLLFGVAADQARIMIACAAMPTATNVYLLSQSYGFAPQRASAAILFSTVASLGTLTLVFLILL